jgi:class III poly(R)-hydroxyalkanoic acid synthase PhaE subunit
VSNSNDWTESWMNSQQNYWKAWADLAQRGMKVPEAPKNPFADGLAQWWQSVSPMAPPTGRDVFDKVMDVSKGYFSLAERFMSGAQAKPDGGMEAINNWLDGMQKTWSDWTQMGSAFRPEGMFSKDQFKGMNTFLDLPMDTWNRLAANVMPMPGDYTQAFQQNGAQPMQDQISKFLSVPAVGYSREAQEQYQILAQRQMDYMAATQAYQMAFGKLGMESTKGFQAALQTRMKDGKPISSLRELYDQWVEMSEAAYAEFVMTEEYQTLYGRLVNTLLALKQQMARMVDQNLEAMNMPTRTEISTLQCRQQELRRDNLKLHKDMKAMQAQLEAMRQSMLQMQAAPKPAAPAAKAEAVKAETVKAEPVKAAAPKAAAKPVAAAKPAAVKPVAGKPAATKSK